ncbi:hypothetical protein ANCCAN_12470 [Ancylostoma caninum]|uniref:Uncharacterized protein n=1 Tax=Ancylostoma caninum TaxID=29170 RepID=A0A368GCZ2_ANCCA|nr:hypothetical protein ANCCAN_12470 [Ancylostoma caninum]
MAMPLMLLFVLAPLLFIFLFRLSVVQNCRAKMILMRKRAMQDRVESRRTSRVTEETLLRLEERSSLSSSDYSGQLIPFIDLGTIQIHERIGKVMHLHSSLQYSRRGKQTPTRLSSFSLATAIKRRTLHVT